MLYLRDHRIVAHAVMVAELASLRRKATNYELVPLPHRHFAATRVLKGVCQRSSGARPMTEQLTSFA